MGSLLLPCAAPGVSLRAVWCLSGATPWGQPWTPTVTLPHGCTGLSARGRAVWWPCRAPARCRHVAPCMTAQRVARLHPSSTRTCLPPKP